jgi:signal transduction histidine kinase
MYKHWWIILAAWIVVGCSPQASYDLPDQVAEVTAMERLSEDYLAGVEDLVSSKNELEEAWGLYLRARDLVVNGASVESLPMIERSEILFRSNNNLRGLSRILLLKAHSYWALGAGEEILSASQETMALRQGDTLAWATAAGNYSTYLIDFGYYSEALEYSDTVLAIFKSLAGKINPSEAYAVRAEALYHVYKNPKEVDSLIQGALALVDSAGVPDIDKQNIYFRALGLEAMNQVELAQCIEFAHARNFWDLEAQARRQFTEYDLLGESRDEAKEAEIVANRLALRRVDASQSRFLAFELERGKRERLRYEETAKLRQQTLAIFLSMALILAIGIWVSYRSVLRTKEARLSVQEAELELESYKNKIRPHFLFNQLNNVNGILNQERMEDAQEYLAELGQYLRSLLQDQSGHFVYVGAELDQLEKYAALQQQSSYAHVTFTIEVPKALRKARIPSGILQPLVENSFKYAGSANAEDSCVHITMVQEGESLQLEVLDSGYGETLPKGGTGHGLTLVKQRIEYHRKQAKKGEQWSLQTSFTKAKGTVKITVPLLTDKSA